MRLYRAFSFFFFFLSVYFSLPVEWDGVCAAEQSYARGEYFDAARHYKTAYTRTSPKDRSQRGVLAYKQGDCYRRINYTLKAKGAYMNAVRYRYPDTLSSFYLAEMLRKNGEHAQRLYLIMRITLLTHRPCLPRKNVKTLSDTNRTHLLSSGAGMEKKPTRYIVKRVPILVSAVAIILLCMGDDPDILYFTSTRNEAKGTDLNGITG